MPLIDKLSGEYTAIRNTDTHTVHNHHLPNRDLLYIQTELFVYFNLYTQGTCYCALLTVYYSWSIYYMRTLQ